MRIDPASVLAVLPSDTDVVAVRDGTSWVIAASPEETLIASGPDALGALACLRRGWWAGFLAYDLGRAVERVVPRSIAEPPVPDLALGRFSARLVLSRLGPRLEGGGPARRALEQALERAGEAPPLPQPDIGPWESNVGRQAYEQWVRAALERIAHGECYQVNLTRRLTAPAAADGVALFAALLRENPAPHAAFVRLAGVTVVSASPERFLRRDGSRVETRPIKGTGEDAEALERSAKDRAENVMIVDLARNDLGRVCVPGTVRVVDLCAVERHPGLVHLVSTVTGRLHRGAGTADLVRATFPPASVTGAPKPRVMQIIEDLEPLRRGVYCGAIGWIDEDRRALDLSVAIRTFTIAAGRTTLGVGGGIVADSDPAAEWEETELKARRLLHAAGARAVTAGR